MYLLYNTSTVKRQPVFFTKLLLSVEMLPLEVEGLDPDLRGMQGSGLCSLAWVYRFKPDFSSAFVFGLPVSVEKYLCPLKWQGTIYTEVAVGLNVQGAGFRKRIQEPELGFRTQQAQA